MSGFHLPALIQYEGRTVTERGFLHNAFITQDLYISLLFVSIFRVD